MSFKFKIGQVVKRSDTESEELFRVVSLMLSGYVKVRSLETHFPTIVRADEFEEAHRVVDTDP
jgi:hypothetical protein